MTVNPALAAVEDAERLFSWAKGNALALNDPAVEQATFAAMSGSPTLHADQSFDVTFTPLLRDTADVGTVPLLEAAVLDKRWRMLPPCDRCASEVEPAHRLRVPWGASVVEVRCCTDCRLELDTDYSGLVWS